MEQFPKEFADCLTPYGWKLLEQGLPSTEFLTQQTSSPFIAIAGAIKPDFCQQAYELLNKRLQPHLVLLEQPIPAFTTWNMVENYKERLPKVVRLRTAYLDSIKNKAYQTAKEIGLLAMLDSGTFHHFVRQLTGDKLRSKQGKQVLCYEEGDYTGPHNDHHPEEPEAAAGYLDCHITFVGQGVAHQWLVYEKNSHFTQIQSLHEPGLITIYRLPFWHFTTPLVVDPGSKSEQKRRWILLGTFLFDRRMSQTKKRLEN